MKQFLKKHYLLWITFFCGAPLFWVASLAMAELKTESDLRQKKEGVQAQIEVLNGPQELSLTAWAKAVFPSFTLKTYPKGIRVSGTAEHLDALVAILQAQQASCPGSLKVFELQGYPDQTVSLEFEYEKGQKQ